MNNRSTMRGILLSLYYGFKEVKNSNVGKSWNKERELEKKLITFTFSDQMLKGASDDEFLKAFKDTLPKLWAMGFWAKPEQHVDKIIARNGVKKLREAFYELIYGNAPIRNRFNNFRSNIWGLGTATITEILCFIKPEKYPIWNRKVIIALSKLELLKDVAQILGYKEVPSDIDGLQYEKITEYLAKLKQELEQASDEKFDFPELDYFLYCIAETRILSWDEKKRIWIPKLE